MSSRRAVAGHSLIEVLVAMVVATATLFGLAIVQARSLSMQVDAESRRHAVALIEQLRERVSANHEGYAKALHSQYARTWLAGDPIGAPACGAGRPCDAVTGTPALQLAQWMQDVRARLPGAVARIGPLVAGSGQAVSVTVGWAEPNATRSAPDNGCASIPSVAARAEYRCVTVVFYPG